MSDLDNALGKSELGLRYTTLPQLDHIVASYESSPPPIPEGYRRRPWSEPDSEIVAPVQRTGASDFAAARPTRCPWR